VSRLFVLIMLNVFVLSSVIPAYCQSILLLKWIKGYSYNELAEPYYKSKPNDEFYLFTPSQIYLCNPKQNYILPWGNEIEYLGSTPAGVLYFKQTAVNGTTGIFTIFPQRRIVVETVSLMNPLNQTMQVSVDYYQVLRALTPNEFKENYRNK
jgi:hypothetical protein